MLTKLRVLLLLLAISATPVLGQLPEGLLESFTPREIGPAIMGGRTIDFAVYEEDPSIFYAATASGGLLKTVNGGTSWENVFDRQGTVSIGAVAINPDDPNVVWVGTGEANNRQSSSWGDGVYRSTDGGRTWAHVGLRESHHVGRIIVHPHDTDIVWVAALGHLWGPNPERGVFMTTDGGLTWEHVLRIDENTGAVDLAIDPSNPKILYAGAYARRRSGWGFNGGGPNGGLFKSADGGRTWRRLTRGLPEGPVGRVGVNVSRSNPNVVYTIVENADGGVFRSEDKGETWTRVNSYNPRPMYYSKIHVDPTDDKRIYVLGTRLARSEDAGRTFVEEIAPEVHLDHHGFWINPRNPRHLITGNDGGIWVSRDMGGRWEHLNNVPIGQFYNVTVDMQQPYHVYGGMQDNASWGGPSAVRDRQGIANDHWYQMLACDGMFVAVDPQDDHTLYTNCQNGRIIRYDQRTGERKQIQPQPAAGEPPLRWNWTTPIVISPHDPATIYTAANRVFRSPDRGHSWAAISPDLSLQIDRDTLMLMGIRGSDITLSRNDGMSNFGNVTALAESRLRAGLMYAGTDDGRVHVTRDGGATWTDLTRRIPGAPPLVYVSRLTPSAADEGTVYLSFDGHRSDDMRPYVFMSTDFGNSWRSITANLPTGSVYIVEEDQKNPNLLYVGTEFGLFVSIDRGGAWTRWGSLPTVAVYDLVVHPRENDLVLGTHGRSIIIYDDISPLQQLTPAVLASDSHLFDVRPATQFIPNENGWFLGGRSFRGANPELGAYVNYYLRSAVDRVSITISDGSGNVLRQLEGAGGEPGIHRVAWDLRAEGVGPIALGLAGAFNLTNLGPFVLPGEYTVRLSAGGSEHTKTVRVNGDPLIRMADADRRALYEALLSLTEMQRTAESAAGAIEKMGEQLGQVSALLGEQEEGAPEAVRNSLEAANRQVADLRTRLVGGGGGGGGGGFGGGQALRNRINSLKSELIGSQSVPTELQSGRFVDARRELNDLVQEVNRAMDTTLPNVYRQLYGSNVVPAVGQPIRLVGAGG